MTAISSLNTVPTRSYVYVPRERHVAPFSGGIDKDGRSGDEFIEEVERILAARNQSVPEQFDFVMSLLRGPAFKEVHLRRDDETDQVTSLATSGKLLETNAAPPSCYRISIVSCKWLSAVREQRCVDPNADSGKEDAVQMRIN